MGTDSNFDLDAALGELLVQESLEERAIAKIVNFARAYGMAAREVAQQRLRVMQTCVPAVTSVQEARATGLRVGYRGDAFFERGGVEPVVYAPYIPLLRTPRVLGHHEHTVMLDENSFGGSAFRHNSAPHVVQMDFAKCELSLISLAKNDP